MRRPETNLEEKVSISYKEKISVGYKSWTERDDKFNVLADCTTVNECKNSNSCGYSPPMFEKLIII